MSRKKEVSHNQIAKDLGRSQATIPREILRNTGLRGYRHKQADRLTAERHAKKPKFVKLTDEIKYLLGVCLRNDWSPEQIAGRFHDEGLKYFTMKLFTSLS